MGSFINYVDITGEGGLSYLIKWSANGGQKYSHGLWMTIEKTLLYVDDPYCQLLFLKFKSDL